MAWIDVDLSQNCAPLFNAAMRPVGTKHTAEFWQRRCFLKGKLI